MAGERIVGCLLGWLVGRWVTEEVRCRPAAEQETQTPPVFPLASLILFTTSPTLSALQCSVSVRSLVFGSFLALWVLFWVISLNSTPFSFCGYHYRPAVHDLDCCSVPLTHMHTAGTSDISLCLETPRGLSHQLFILLKQLKPCGKGAPNLPSRLPSFLMLSSR